MLSEPITRRLLLARYLYSLAAEHARSHREVAGFACVNMLQDALEAFLLAAADHLNAPIQRKTAFEQYLDLINDKLTPPQTLPFRARLLEINKVRVLSKHDGIGPNKKELEGYVKTSREFFERATTLIFQKDFWTISLSQMLPDGEIKQLIEGAEAQFESGEYANCLISCRRAFYLEFETEYDVKMFEAGQVSPLFAFGNKAHYWTQNKEWIEKNVSDPFEFIQLDHARVDSDLVRDGIDPNSFWNVWRLTPSVYRHKEQDPWITKHDDRLFENSDIMNRAAYVLEATTEMLLRKASSRSAARWMKHGEYVVALKTTEVQIYAKADRTSPSVERTPPNETKIVVQYATQGLKGDGDYWKISHGTGDPKDGTWKYYYGYIHSDDVDTS